MGNLKNPKSYKLLCFLQIVTLLQIQVSSYQYKVGDLDAWGIPPSSNPHIYTTWPLNHTFKIGDSLLFLYPPSQDSVIQITEQSFSSCDLKDPILYMNDGNSIFNITALGQLYFTSSEQGHCEKKQKLQISVGNGTTEDSSSYLPATSPSYSPVFGTIPAPPSSARTNYLSVLAAGFVGICSCIFIIGKLALKHSHKDFMRRDEGRIQLRANFTKL